MLVPHLIFLSTASFWHCYVNGIIVSVMVSFTTLFAHCLPYFLVTLVDQVEHLSQTLSDPYFCERKIIYPRSIYFKPSSNPSSLQSLLYYKTQIIPLHVMVQMKLFSLVLLLGSWAINKGLVLLLLFVSLFVLFWDNYFLLKKKKKETYSKNVLGYQFVNCFH